jgi:predicted TPR repeat methyltransferase
MSSTAEAVATSTLERLGYDAVSERYRGNDDRPPEYAAWLRTLSARLPSRARVLDLGCGCGVRVGRELVALRHHVVGVDFSRNREHLDRSLARFVGHDGYDLRTDMNSFVFLLGADDGDRLFGTE